MIHMKICNLVQKNITPYLLNRPIIISLQSLVIGAVDYPGTYILNDNTTVEDLYQLNW
jgi:hypothetical protein